MIRLVGKVRLSYLLLLWTSDLDVLHLKTIPPPPSRAFLRLQKCFLTCTLYKTLHLR